jgi:hypothetical protein
MGNIYILVSRTKGKKPLRRIGRRRNNIIKMGL